MRTMLAAAIVLSISSAVSAQDTFTFEAVNGFVFIEMETDGEDFTVEYITSVEASTFMCVIVDDTGTPIEIQRDISNDGDFVFYAAALPAKDRLLCQAEE